MGKYEVSPFNGELMLVKAVCDRLNGIMVIGFYCEDCGNAYVKIPQNEAVVPINPKTVCRNSGIKDKYDEPIYEYDLLKLTHGLKPPCYGFLIWDNFYKAWKIRRRTDRTAYCNIDDWAVEVVGNIVIDADDAEKLYNQEKEEDAKEAFIDNSYCPSKFKK